MRRLVLPGQELTAGRLDLPPAAVHYVSRVLRLRSGDALWVLDGHGAQAEGVVEAMSSQRVTVRLSPPIPATASAAPSLHLILALPKGNNKFDEITRRATELGVTSIRPALSERSVARPPSERQVQRVERWQRIAAEASRQCRRSRVPEVAPLVPLATALAEEAQTGRLGIMLWEGEGRKTLAECFSALSCRDGVVLVVGPEGGFSVAEARQAEQLGFVTASLGPLILRVETAAVTACSIAQLFLGHFDLEAVP